MSTKTDSFDASKTGAFQASQFGDARNYPTIQTPRGCVHVAVCSHVGEAYLEGPRRVGIAGWDYDVSLWNLRYALGARAILCKLASQTPDPELLIPPDRTIPDGITLIEKDYPTKSRDLDDLLSLAQAMTPPPGEPPLDAWSGGAVGPTFAGSVFLRPYPTTFDVLAFEWLRSDGFQNLFAAPTVIRPARYLPPWGDVYWPFLAGGYGESVFGGGFQWLWGWLGTINRAVALTRSS
ncbi:MAG: hypothetical protein A2Y38_25100 [Spirochaetes bacterium GWB1_59_5]|nr:MAG: hypothetical protein A2Y38_25100 [Spirochaetes bacterium GWB1_59_5]